MDELIREICDFSPEGLVELNGTVRLSPLPRFFIKS